MAALHKVSKPLHGFQSSLPLDDAEEEVWRPTATQQLPQFEGAVYSLDEFYNRRWKLSSWSSKKGGKTQR